MSEEGLDFLKKLETVIQERIANPEPGSYTSTLAARGPQRIAQKLGEEAVELALASVAGGRGEVVEEAADLLYHLLVLLNSRGLTLAEIVAALENRHAG